MNPNQEPESFASRIARFLDNQDETVAAARAIANDENASAEDRASAIAELQAVRNRIEQRAPTHIDRLLSSAIDPSADPALRAISRRFFIDLHWLREEDFVLYTMEELRTRVVAIMKEQGRWPDGID